MKKESLRWFFKILLGIAAIYFCLHKSLPYSPGFYVLDKKKFQRWVLFGPFQCLFFFFFPPRDCFLKQLKVHKQTADMPYIFVAWTVQLHNDVMLASLISKLMDGL